MKWSFEHDPYLSLPINFFNNLANEVNKHTYCIVNDSLIHFFDLREVKRPFEQLSSILWPTWSISTWEIKNKSTTLKLTNVVEEELINFYHAKKCRRHSLHHLQFTWSQKSAENSKAKWTVKVIQQYLSGWGKFLSYLNNSSILITMPVTEF